MIRSGHSFRYPSTVLNYWKPRPSYVAPSADPEVLVPEDDDQEVEEELVFNPDELKNIKRRILWSLKKLGRNSFYGKERSGELLESLVKQPISKGLTPLFRLN
eukprot:06255.XXX_130169_129803_1 [CDS] Oithona nana genome sequencing.